MAAYIVFIRLRTRDPEQLALYAKQAPAFMAGHAVRPLANFSGSCESLEGAAAEGAAILEFPTLAEAKAWYVSPAYQKACEHRYQGGDYCAMILEGVAPGPTKDGKG